MLVYQLEGDAGPSLFNISMVSTEAHHPFQGKILPWERSLIKILKMNPVEQVLSFRIRW